MREALATRGIESEYLHFPRFDAPIYGDLIARFLRGELGALEQVNPYLVALLYAGDRAEAAPMIRGWLSEGKAVIVDRYVYSNVGYQCAKFKTEHIQIFTDFDSRAPRIDNLDKSRKDKRQRKQYTAQGRYRLEHIFILPL